VRDLPPPLPPAERTVGQFVGETIRVYGDNFWRALPLGVPLALADQLATGQQGEQLLVFLAVGPLFVAAYVWGCRLVLRARPTMLAFLVGALVYLPFPALRAVFVLPGIAWFAFIGLAVPAALVEQPRFREALVRGRILGMTDYVHALGSLAVLVLVVGIGDQALTVALHSQADNSQRAALFISDLVLSPLLYLGGALLYVDQAARVVGSGSRRSEPRTRKPRSRRDAHFHPPVDAQPAGRADDQVEP
jgi:hypothetical protein